MVDRWYSPPLSLSGAGGPGRGPPVPGRGGGWARLDLTVDLSIYISVQGEVGCEVYTLL